jgi:nucleotide-binding universal stress UspA family protein
MFQTIFVPLDGSLFAENALPYAAAIARHSGACIRVVRKHLPAQPVHPDSVLANDPKLDPLTWKAERQYLDAITRRLVVAGVPAVASALLEGPTVEAIATEVTAAKADLVVMTTHGRGPVARFWLGSVADALVRRLTTPILLIRPADGEPSAQEPALPRRVLIPLDGSALAVGVLESAVHLAGFGGAEVTLLDIVVPVPLAVHEPGGLMAAGTDLEIMEKLQAEARRYVNNVADRLRACGLTVREQVMVHPHPAAAILEAARDGNADLIALETHGRGGLGRLFLGSVADKLLRAALCPVLVHRTAEPSPPKGGKS